MEIYSISVNKVNFNGLVPIAKYSGTPKLTQEAINGIKKIKTMIKDTECDILELESQACATENGGYINLYLRKRLNIVYMYRKKLLNEIKIIKNNNYFNEKRLISIQNNKFNYDKKCDKLLDIINR